MQSYQYDEGGDVHRSSSNGWLASSFGCCAHQPHDSDQHEDRQRLRKKSISLRAASIVSEQPQSIEPPSFQTESPPEARPGRPTTSHSTWLGRARQSSDIPRARTTSFSSLRRPWTSSSSKRRPSISARTMTISGPTDFRRVNGVDMVMSHRRRSFRPLELSIYLPHGRLSPLPDFSTDSWSDKPSGLEMPAQAMIRPTSTASAPVPNRQIRRKPSSLDHHYRGASFSSVATNVDAAALLDRLEQGVMDPIPPRSSSLGMTSIGIPTIAAPPPALPAVPRPVLASRSRTQSEASLSSLSLLPQRKNSLRRQKTDTVEEAIRELNTIVEERREAALRLSNSSLKQIPVQQARSNQHHVPAIAPSMKVRARSETLSDIGSALSVPLSMKPPQATPSPKVPGASTIAPQHHPVRPRDAGVTDSVASLSAFPLPPTNLPRPKTAPEQTSAPEVVSSRIPHDMDDGQATPTATSRLRIWLRKSVPTSPSRTPTTTSQPQTPFYQCTDFPSASRSANSSSSSVSSQLTYSFEPSLPTRTGTMTTSTSMTSPASPRPSISKSGRSFSYSSRRRPRGLTVSSETETAYKESESHRFPPPPKYQVVDPHPSGPNSPLTPVSPAAAVGLAF